MALLMMLMMRVWLSYCGSGFDSWAAICEPCCSRRGGCNHCSICLCSSAAELDALPAADAVATTADEWPIWSIYSRSTKAQADAGQHRSRGSICLMMYTDARFLSGSTDNLGTRSNSRWLPGAGPDACDCGRREVELELTALLGHHQPNQVHQWRACRRS